MTLLDPPGRLSRSAIRETYQQLVRFPERIMQSYLTRYGQLPLRHGPSGQDLEVLYNCSNTAIDHEHHLYRESPALRLGETGYKPDDYFALTGNHLKNAITLLHVREDGKYVPQKLCLFCSLHRQQGLFMVREYRCARCGITRCYLLSWRSGPEAEACKFPSDGFAIIQPLPRPTCSCERQVDWVMEWGSSKKLFIRLATWLSEIQLDQESDWQWQPYRKVIALAEEYHQYPLLHLSRGAMEPQWDAAMYHADCPVLPGGQQRATVALTHAVPSIQNSVWSNTTHELIFRQTMINAWEWIGKTLVKSLENNWCGVLGE